MRCDRHCRVAEAWHVNFSRCCAELTVWKFLQGRLSTADADPEIREAQHKPVIRPTTSGYAGNNHKCEEVRVDPADGDLCSLQGLLEKYRDHHPAEKLQDYWVDCCWSPEEDDLRPEAEVRVEPEEETLVTLAGLRRKCRGRYPVKQVDDWWRGHCHPVAQDAVAEPSEAFLGLLREVLWRHPRFLLSGRMLPLAAPQWSAEELEAYVGSDGAEAPPARVPLVAVPLPHCVLPDLRGTVPGAAEVTPQGSFPRIIWMYWRQGAGDLSHFRRLCIHSWQVQNPGWDVVLLDKQSALRYVHRNELPEHWDTLASNADSDALRLALLEKFGGVYADVATVCLRPLDAWLWSRLAVGLGDRGPRVAAFYYEAFGCRPNKEGEYIENWFLAAPRGHALIASWRRVFCEFWQSRREACCPPLIFDPMFANVDLTAMNAHQRNYLTMHACFKKLIDEDAAARQLWATDLLPFRADDAALGWILGLGSVTSEAEAALRWLHCRDDAWVDGLAERAPLVKFIGLHAQALDKQPWVHLAHRDWCLTRLLALGCSVRQGPLLEYTTRSPNFALYSGQEPWG